MGYRSDVLWVAIVPSIKEANECIKAYMVLTKLEQTQPPYPDDVKGVFVVDTQDDPAYITYVGREVKWYESSESVNFINNFFEYYVKEYFNVKDMSWGCRFFRVGEEHEDVEVEEYICERETYSELLWESASVVRYIESPFINNYYHQ